jgi:hypothetical protein
VFLACDVEYLSFASILLCLASLFGFIDYRFLRLPNSVGLMVVALAASLCILGLARRHPVRLLRRRGVHHHRARFDDGTGHPMGLSEPVASPHRVWQDIKTPITAGDRNATGETDFWPRARSSMSAAPM